jgi:2-succinyl-5-enolpyruvyl-6-hydroxy-3-cyclohexene-1-carboxylate synthase
MTSDKKSIALLADLFVKHGLEDIIISPGSRNAPIIITFAGNPSVNAISITDERSAAFYALGMAQEKKKAVAIACTSGTAVLNYAPAIAEAYYHKIPMLILTADRPPEYIDIGDGQCIRQKDVYKNYIKASFEVPEDLSSEASFGLANEMINEAINLAHGPEPGPVHINLPFSEPLYHSTEETVSGKVDKHEGRHPELSESYIQQLADEWNRYERVLLIAGQQDRNEKLNDVLKKLVEEKNFVLLTETTSNLYGENFVGCIDNVLVAIKENEEKIHRPDLLVTFGGHVVSKKIKKYLRNNKPQEHWHISPSGEGLDTYFSLTKVIRSGPEDRCYRISSLLKPATPVFASAWMRKRNRVIDRREKFLDKTEYSDLKVFEMLLGHIPTGTTLHLGNSTPVRYAQLFGSNEWLTYRSNRGVSGIDGHISTAAGAAMASKDLHIVITGDLGFFYDLNSLMQVPANLKVILINNGGGGIFRFIPGPDTSPYLEKFFEARHDRKAEKFVEAFGLKYYKARSVVEMLYVLPEFFNEKEGSAILEIFTPGEKNAVILREYFKYLAG